LREHRHCQRKTAPEPVAAIADRGAVDCSARLRPSVAAEASPQIPGVSALFARSRARRCRAIAFARHVDLGMTLVEKKSRAGIQVRPLLELPLILLVHKKSKVTQAEELWKRDKIEETLISFPRTDPVQTHFQRGLERLGVEWFCGIEVNSSRLI